ncbi:hypothetical protein L7F22_041884 [Adiantum nelumboides]|nr:hypothetical protein [Adiantum nelumboides]
MGEEMCRECQRETQITLDYASGDSVCTECGLVMESHIVDERPEWRVFEGDDSSDKIRVGAPSSLLTDSNDLHIHIDKAPPSIVRLESHASTSPHSKRLALAFKEIRRLADRMHLMPSIHSRACEIFRTAEDSVKGRRKEAFYAACLELASQQEGSVRWSIKSIAQYCDTSIGDIHKAKSHLLQHLGGNIVSSSTAAAADVPCENLQAMPVNGVCVSSGLQIEKLIRRFCCSINMDVRAIRAAMEMTKSVQENLDIRRSPISIAATCIHIAAVLCDPKCSLPDIARATNITEETIRRTYKDLFPHVGKIIPAWINNKGC